MAFTILGKRVRFPRIPMFRVFYSLTYTVLYLITLVFLAITPITMIYGSIKQSALQYTAMIGAAYVLLAVTAIFIYSSRLYTNRSILSAVGKAYIPIEDGEIGKLVRKMIVKQLQRSAIVAWESRPRDLYGEIMSAEQEGLLPPETSSLNKDAYYVGTEIRVDPQDPPWGEVQHPGWSSPSHSSANITPDVQYDSVIAELPNLIEAQAVSLAPPDPLLTPVYGEQQLADAAIVDVLKRSANMAMREYLTQLSYLGLVSPAAGQSFLPQYEQARFSGRPVTTDEFNSLMDSFSKLLDGLKHLDPAIVNEIRAQASAKGQDDDTLVPRLSFPSKNHMLAEKSSSSRMFAQHEPRSESITPVTAYADQSSPAVKPYLHPTASEDSLGSVVVHNSAREAHVSAMASSRDDVFSSSVSLNETTGSESGSVIVRHDLDGHNHT